MFIRKYWIPITVFLVVIVGVGLYLLTSQTPKEKIVIYKPVEPLPKTTEAPKAKAPVGDTSQGHFHADGTFHAEPHEAPVQPTAPNGNPDVVTETLPLSFPELPSTALSPEDQAVVDAMYKRLAQEDPELYADSKAIDDAYEELFAEQQKIHNDMLSDNADWAEIRAARRKLKEKHRQARALIDNFRAKYVSP